MVIVVQDYFPLAPTFSKCKQKPRMEDNYTPPGLHSLYGLRAWPSLGLLGHGAVTAGSPYELQKWCAPVTTM